jgi:hypothetical protein
MEEGMLVLEKSYTDEDFVKFDYDLGGEMPSISYESITFIDPQSGIVISNDEKYDFNIT